MNVFSANLPAASSQKTASISEPSNDFSNDGNRPEKNSFARLITGGDQSANSNEANQANVSTETPSSKEANQPNESQDAINPLAATAQTVDALPAISALAESNASAGVLGQTVELITPPRTTDLLPTLITQSGLAGHAQTLNENSAVNTVAEVPNASIAAAASSPAAFPASAPSQNESATTPNNQATDLLSSFGTNPQNGGDVTGTGTSTPTDLPTESPAGSPNANSATRLADIPTRIPTASVTPPIGVEANSNSATPLNDNSANANVATSEAALSSNLSSVGLESIGTSTATPTVASDTTASAPDAALSQRVDNVKRTETVDPTNVTRANESTNSELVDLENALTQSAVAESNTSNAIPSGSAESVLKTSAAALASTTSPITRDSFQRGSEVVAENVTLDDVPSDLIEDTALASDADSGFGDAINQTLESDGTPELPTNALPQDAPANTTNAQGLAGAYSFEAGIENQAGAGPLAQTIDVAPGDFVEGQSVGPLPNSAATNNSTDALAAIASKANNIGDGLFTSPTDQVKVAVATHFRTLDGESSKTLSMELHPAELGQLQIRVEQTGDQLIAHIVATEASSTELLLQQRDQLVKALDALGLGESTLDISQGEQRQHDTDQQRPNLFGRTSKSSSSAQSSNTGTIPSASAETSKTSGVNFLA